MRPQKGASHIPDLEDKGPAERQAHAWKGSGPRFINQVLRDCSMTVRTQIIHPMIKDPWRQPRRRPGSYRMPRDRHRGFRTKTPRQNMPSGEEPASQPLPLLDRCVTVRAGVWYCSQSSPFPVDPQRPTHRLLLSTPSAKILTQSIWGWKRMDWIFFPPQKLLSWLLGQMMMIHWEQMLAVKGQSWSFTSFKS